VVILYRVGVIGGVTAGARPRARRNHAVTFIIGNSFRISSSIFARTTISAAIASDSPKAMACIIGLILSASCCSC